LSKIGRFRTPLFYRASDSGEGECPFGSEEHRSPSRRNPVRLQRGIVFALTPLVAGDPHNLPETGPPDSVGGHPRDGHSSSSASSTSHGTVSDLLPDGGSAPLALRPAKSFQAAWWIQARINLMRATLLALPSLCCLAYGQLTRPLDISAPANESVFRTGSDITLVAHCSADFVRFVVDGASVGQAPCAGIKLWKATRSPHSPPNNPISC
jgi:hypothetical protein